MLKNNLLPYDGEAFYLPNFFSKELADIYFEKILNEVNWREEAIRIFGKKVLQPRRTAWYGDKDYSYSGITMTNQPWLQVLLKIKVEIETKFDLPFDGVLLNHYRNGRDSMGWHRDNEKELGDQPDIASVSFGESRRFVFRNRARPDKKVEINLEHGSLLLMRGKSQQAWDHAIPKTARPIADRINLTFRKLYF